MVTHGVSVQMAANGLLFPFLWAICLLSTFGLIVMHQEQSGFVVLILVPGVQLLDVFWANEGVASRQLWYVLLHAGILHALIFSEGQWSNLTMCCVAWHVGILCCLFHLRHWMIPVKVGPVAEAVTLTDLKVAQVID